ncbi:MAG TPA: urease accessory UreF family protein [Gammaproteobacteria bacterium]
MTPHSVRLWQLVSPTLPVGAFSFSQGLEQAVAAGAVRDEGAALAWIGGLLAHGVARVDLPVLLRVHLAWSVHDAAAVACWSEELTARRETAELRLEDASMGRALADVLGRLGVALPSGDLPFPCAFGAACAEWGVPPVEAAAGYAWSWCEAQVAAAVKLVPLGHTAGQRLLLALGARIGPAVQAAAALDDDDIGASLPGFALASALHETQYTRLFRS